jgi:hypothetical protein
MNAVKTSGGCSTSDAARRCAGGEQLRPRDHAMLSTGDLGDQGVRALFVALLPHSGKKSTTAAISPPSLPVFDSS